MKRIVFLTMMTLMLSLVSSCDNDLTEYDPAPIEPEYLPMFQFDSNGIPHRPDAPYLSNEMQNALKKEFVGYGWKWMQTNEIYGTGFVEQKEYYEQMIGMSPTSYYIETDEILVKYYHADSSNKDVSECCAYEMDSKSGMLTTPKWSSYGMPWSMYMRVWTIYKLSGKWYMSCTEPLALRNTDSGHLDIVWGTSQYVRMTDNELKQMQEKHKQTK